MGFTLILTFILESEVLSYSRYGFFISYTLSFIDEEIQTLLSRVSSVYKKQCFISELILSSLKYYVSIY